MLVTAARLQFTRVFNLGINKLVERTFVLEKKRRRRRENVVYEMSRKRSGTDARTSQADDYSLPRWFRNWGS